MRPHHDPPRARTASPAGWTARAPPQSTMQQTPTVTMLRVTVSHGWTMVARPADGPAGASRRDSDPAVSPGAPGAGGAAFRHRDVLAVSGSVLRWVGRVWRAETWGWQANHRNLEFSRRRSAPGGPPQLPPPSNHRTMARQCRAETGTSDVITVAAFCSASFAPSRQGLDPAIFRASRPIHARLFALTRLNIQIFWVLLSCGWCRCQYIALVFWDHIYM